MIFDEVVFVCALALAEMSAAWGGHLPPQAPDRMDVCVEIGRSAEERHLPMVLAVSVAYEESKFDRKVVSRVGARGPLQIIPRYHCPSISGVVDPSKRKGVAKGCDLIKHGVGALAFFWRRYGEGGWDEALCHYNSGEKCVSASRQYAARVLKRTRLLEAQLKVALTQLSK